MFGSALPFWAEVGEDRVRGGFHEALDASSTPLPDAPRRLRVACRQVYVFSHAACLGWGPGLAVARRGAEWLVAKGWQGADRGWAKVLSPAGEVTDPTPDLYDHAFALFAFAWLHRAGGDPDALAWAHRTLDFVEAHLRHPSAPGFLHARPAVGWRLQNPHMHLLEAALAAWETWHDPRFADLAHELVGLFTTRFFDARRGTLAEAFTDTLERAPGDAGRVVEPGHQFEWAWILSNYQRLFARPVAAEARALVTFAEAHGVRRGVTLNAVRDDGEPLDRGSRTWPNTERIKGHVALFELDGTDPTEPIAQSTAVLLGRYCHPDGTWTDELDGAGAPVAKAIPASTLYHIFLAFTEMLRVEGTLGADIRGEHGGAPLPATLGGK